MGQSGYLSVSSVASPTVTCGGQSFTEVAFPEVISVIPASAEAVLEANPVYCITLDPASAFCCRCCCCCSTFSAARDGLKGSFFGCRKYRMLALFFFLHT